MLALKRLRQDHCQVQGYSALQSETLSLSGLKEIWDKFRAVPVVPPSTSHPAPCPKPFPPSGWSFTAPHPHPQHSFSFLCNSSVLALPSLGPGAYLGWRFLSWSLVPTLLSRSSVVCWLCSACVLPYIHSKNLRTLRVVMSPSFCVIFFSNRNKNRQTNPAGILHLKRSTVGPAWWTLALLSVHISSMHIVHTTRKGSRHCTTRFDLSYRI